MTSDIIDSLISFEQEQITSEITAIGKISFNLTSQDVEQIIRYKKDCQKIPVSKKLLGELRYSVLLQNYSNWQFPLSFTTYYVRKQQKVAVIKSVIDIQGRITQCFCRGFLDRPHLFNDIITAHYWLIEQICDRLSLKYNRRVSLFTAILSLTIVLVIAPFLLYFVSLNWIIKLLLIIVTFLVCKIILDTYRKHLASFILQQLIFGFFSKNSSRKNLGFKLLSYL